MTDRSAWLLQAKAGVFCVWKDAGTFHITEHPNGHVLATRDNVNHAFQLANDWHRDGVPASMRPEPAHPPAAPVALPAPAPVPVATTPAKPATTPMGQRGQGRKRLYDEPTVSTGMRMTAAQLAKLEQLGGPAWVRRMIDRAKVPEKATA